jgi:hypothetical protein
LPLQNLFKQAAATWIIFLNLLELGNFRKQVALIAVAVVGLLLPFVNLLP